MEDVLHIYLLPFIICILISSILGYIGIHVIKREIIFIDIAIAQIAILGNIIGHLILGMREGSISIYIFSIICVIAASIFLSLIKQRIKVISLEAVIGILYALSAAGALLLIGKSTEGHVHVKRMMSGNILWVTKNDIILCSITFLIGGMILFLFRKRFQNISAVYQNECVSKEVFLWDIIFYSICGVIITFAVMVAGVAIVFCFLIFPALTSMLYINNWKFQVIILGIINFLSIIFGIIFSYITDFSIGTSISLFLIVILILSCFICRVFDKSQYINKIS